MDPFEIHQNTTFTFNYIKKSKTCQLNGIKTVNDEKPDHVGERPSGGGGRYKHGDATKALICL